MSDNFSTMDGEQTLEGRAPFPLQSIDTPCETYYKIFGDLRNGQPPVILIHGGPGSGHDYLLPFAKLWHLYKLPVVFYDQIGTARSTHLRHKAGDYSFWTVELMVEQLERLIDHLNLRENAGFHVLGHSFGGMVASCFASCQPQGLQKLVLANAPASMDLHLHGLQLCAKDLPDVQHAFDEAIRTKDFQSQSCNDALLRLNKSFWCRADPLPDVLMKTKQQREDDWTVTKSMLVSQLCFRRSILRLSGLAGTVQTLSN